MSRERYSNRSDEQLLEAGRNGDSDVFAELWKRHRLAGLAAARGIAPSLDADDLVSSAYLKILELVRDGRGPLGAFRPYLYRVISSTAADIFREKEAPSEHLDLVADPSDTAPWEDIEFDRNAASRAFDSLPERWQAVLWYAEVEDLRPRQIAPLLGISANGVAALAVRAREGLRSAWVEAHVDAESADRDCQPTLENLQRHQRGTLTARRSREVAAHLETCSSCRAAAAEHSVWNERLGLVLAGIFVAGGGAAQVLQVFPISARIAEAGAAAAVSAGALSGSGAHASTVGGTATSFSGTTAGGVAATAGVGGVAGIGISVTAIAVTASVFLAAAVGGGILLFSGDSDAPVTSPREIAQPLPTAPTAAADDGQADAAEAEEAEAGLVAVEANASGTDAGHETQAPLQPDEEPRGSEMEPEKESAGGSGSSDGGDSGSSGSSGSDDDGDGGGGGGEDNEGDGGAEGGGEDPGVPPGDAKLDPALSAGHVCFTTEGDTGDLQLVGQANDYGVIQARMSQFFRPRVMLISPEFDPENPDSAFENGTYEDPYGNTFTEGFLTATQPSSDNLWVSPSLTPFSKWGGTLTGSNVRFVRIEVRLLLPDGRYSPWRVVSQPLSPAPSC